VEKYIVKLTNEERENLLSLIKKGKAAAKTLTHARILLATDEGNATSKPKTDVEVAELLHVNSKTVKRIRQRLVKEGIDSALLRKPHSQTRPRKMDGDQEAHLVALCCSTAPEGRKRWTLKLLSQRLVKLEIIDAISDSTVGRVLKKKRAKAMAKA